MNESMFCLHYGVHTWLVSVSLWRQTAAPSSGVYHPLEVGWKEKNTHKVNRRMAFQNKISKTWNPFEVQILMLSTSYFCCRWNKCYDRTPYLQNVADRPCCPVTTWPSYKTLPYVYIIKNTNHYSELSVLVDYIFKKSMPSRRNRANIWVL